MPRQEQSGRGIVRPMVHVTRSVQYRYLHRDLAGLGDNSLLAAIRAALAERYSGDVIGQCARARVADLEQSGQLTLLNNIAGELAAANYFCGELVLYRKGFDVPAIEEEMDDTKNSFNIKQFQTDGKSKPVEGALYFAVIGDHVGIIASNAVTPRWLERYLTWLLKDRTEVIAVENRIELNAKIDIVDGKGRTAAKAMTIHPQANDRAKGDQSTLKERASGAGSTVLEVLKLLGFGDNAIEAVRKDIPPGGRLEGDFRVYIKEGNRSRPLSEDTVDHAFRNLPADQLEFEAKGAKIRGNKIQLSEPTKVKQIGAILDVEDALAKIVEQLYRWNQNGDISLGDQ